MRNTCLIFKHEFIYVVFTNFPIKPISLYKIKKDILKKKIEDIEN